MNYELTEDQRHNVFNCIRLKLRETQDVFKLNMQNRFMDVKELKSYVDKLYVLLGIFEKK